MIDAKRIAELRENIRTGSLLVRGAGADVADLITILNEKADAENERLKKGTTAECDYRAKWGMCDQLDDVYKLKAENAALKAELARLKPTPQTDPKAGDVGQEEEK